MTCCDLRISTNMAQWQLCDSLGLFFFSLSFSFSAWWADKRSGNQQYRLHQFVCAGDAPKTAGLWSIRLHQEPLQYLWWHYCSNQVYMLLCVPFSGLLNVCYNNNAACITVYWRSSSFLKMHTGSVLYHNSDSQTECSYYWVMGHLLPVQSDDCQLSWWVLQFHAHPFTIDIN